MPEKTFEREVLDTLIEIRESQKYLARKVDEHHEILNGNGKDGLKIEISKLKDAKLDERLTNLETFKWKLIGGIIVIQTFVGFAVHFLIKLVLR